MKQEDKIKLYTEAEVKTITKNLLSQLQLCMIMKPRWDFDFEAWFKFKLKNL